ncbi:hypothetical protein ACFU99_36780 [Streptomyces sp. NPDC057654]|uniref:hypothetical protein n=1 Tax=Streptomyces sp. NPDC057654 TaxID=3346196 RepID=UPI0036AF3E23
MSEYRSWEEREADAAKTRAEAAKTSAEAKAAEQAVEVGSVKTATETLAEQVKQANLKKKLEGIQQESKDQDEQRKTERREARADDGSSFKTLVTVVVVLGLAAALPAQISYFLGLGGKGIAWLMLPVPVFLELLAWVGVLGTAWAHRKGLSRAPFWTLTAVLASVAGYINATHGTAQFGLIAGVALAVTSVGGPVLWEVRQYLETKAAADARGLEERARDKAKAKADAVEKKLQEQRDEAQDKQRKALFPDAWKQYEQILAARPAGSVDRDRAWEEANRSHLFGDVWTVYEQLLAANPFRSGREAEMWAQAWHRVYRLPLGVTPDSLAVEIAAQQRIEKVLEENDRRAESVAVDLFLREVFPPESGGDDGPDESPGGDSGGGPPDGGGGGAEGATALVRKGKQPSGKSSAKTPRRPLAEADLEKVRKLADALGGADKLSARNVREVLGGGANEYIVRARDAVKAERRGDAP